jgi:hypothetical protein
MEELAIIRRAACDCAAGFCKIVGDMPRRKPHGQERRPALNVEVYTSLRAPREMRTCPESKRKALLQPATVVGVEHDRA